MTTSPDSLVGRTIVERIALTNHLDPESFPDSLPTLIDKQRSELQSNDFAPERLGGFLDRHWRILGHRGEQLDAQSHRAWHIQLW